MFFLKHVNTHTHTHSEIGRKFSIGNCTAVALIALRACIRDRANWDLKTGNCEWSTPGVWFVGALWCSEGKLAEREQPAGTAQGPHQRGTPSISLHREPQLPPTQQRWVTHAAIPGGKQSELLQYSHSEPGGERRSERLVSLVDKDAPAPFINGAPAKQRQQAEGSIRKQYAVWQAS